MNSIRPNLRRQHGFSLIELMIALTLGLLLIAAVVGMILAVSTSNRELTRSSRQIESGRYAMDVLSEDLQHAGFYGQFDGADELLPVADPDPCATALAKLEAALPLAVQGFDAQSGGGFAVPGCVPAGHYLDGTDMVVIRRASTVDSTGALDDDDVYLQGKYNQVIVASGADPTVFNLQNTIPDPVENLPVRKYRVHIYYVSPCSQASGDCSDGIPSLKRLELTASGEGLQWQPVTIATGIENLQLYYGVDSAPLAAPNGSPDAIDGEIYVPNPGDWDTADGQLAWSNVVSIQAYLLARNAEASSGVTAQKTYLLSPSGASAPVEIAASEDRYRRRVFSGQARLTNIVIRRG